MKISETVLGALSLGCLILWVLEFRRTGTFGEHYWLLMLCLAFLLAFMYVRGVHLNRPEQKPPVAVKANKRKKKKS
ncbi:hypothetical protein [Larkinella arboricola]|uniref:Uncharacterized protein n=1 Tax=Larkinella arboricola TaxID=643671 RepID=A0A327X843_LARAB|nr:hypothetical protein [Larkinella arboricola]RAJ99786.1 hypothetical protein LX87_01482 [Larkinella arboricola]